MICKLADFKFEILESEVEQITNSIEFAFDKTDRIGNHPKYFDNGKWTETISFSALFLFKKSSHFENLKDKAKEKKPVLLVFGTGEIYTVLIQNIKTKKEMFTAEGNAVRHNISLELIVYYE